MAATFRISDTFRITGRGLVLAGEIQNGEISNDDLIEFQTDSTVLCRKIKSVEFIYGRNLPPGYLGLIIDCESENEIEDLRNWSPKGAIGTIKSN